VHIYTAGIVYLEGQTAHLALRWEQIQELMRGDIDDETSGKVSLDCLYLTLTPDTEIFFQPALPQRLEICAEIEQAYTDALLPALLIKYQQGAQLEFSDLLISQAGINIPDTTNTQDTTTRTELTWLQLEELAATIEVSQPYTTIKVQHPKNSIRFRAFTCEIANASLLKALLLIIK
jgi:hypothetical protein